MPWAVGHCVFGLFIFKCGQIKLYPSLFLSALIGHFPEKPSSGLNATNFVHSVHPKCFLPKRVSLLKVPWEAVWLSAPYTSFNLSSSAASGHSINQLCGLYHHSILVTHHRLPPSLISTPWFHRPQLESGCFAFPHGHPGPHFLLYHSLNDNAATILHGFLQSFYLCGSS